MALCSLSAVLPTTHSAQQSDWTAPVKWWKHRSACPNETTEQDDPKARVQLAAVEARAYKTYRARESACGRLGKRARAWNWALVAFATSTTVASIGMLTDYDMYGANGGTLLVCLSVLALVASLATTNRDYSGRSRDMFLNYRKIQRISVEMEEFRQQSTIPVTAEAVKKLSDRYQAILDETENHTTGDHLRHFSKDLAETDTHYSNDRGLLRRRQQAVAADFAVTALPYLTLALPVALFIPLVKSLLP